MLNPVEHSSPIFSQAMAWANAGCSIVPTRMDGSKAPIGSWKKYQSERANALQIHEWFKDESVTGFGVITGRVSMNLLMMEFEGRAVAQNMIAEATEIAAGSGLSELWEKIMNGYVEATPSGGIHIYYRISDAPVAGNTKLARQPGEDGGVLIETRGEGGFSIVAPSHGSVHPSGAAWVALRGSPSTIPTLTNEESDAIHDVMRMLDRMPQVASVLEVISAPHGKEDAGGGITPGDDFNKRATWDEIIGPRGWTKIFTSAGITYWRRPGKSIGVSATTGKNDGDNLYVFSTSTEFDAEKPYSKFAAFTHLNYHGDFSQAAKNLRLNGYGVPSISPDRGNAEYVQNHYENVQNDHIAERGEESPIIEAIKFLSTEEALVRDEIIKGRARRQAKAVLDSEDAIKKYDGIVYIETLAEELEQPITEVAWVIEGIIPKSANVTLTAQYKAGKTTMINNLAKSLADGTPFLNYFKPASHDGRIVIFNYEVSENQYRRWMNDVAIEKSEKVTLVHLRGKSVPLRSEHVRDQVVEVLSRLACETWIVDPFARAFTGSGDENSNSDVGVFLDQLDIIKERAGVSNLILPVHTGRAQEFGIDRARGATRIDDWADVRWLLKKTDDGRFFSADGRDVLLEEQLLKFDDRTRNLTLGGGDARSVKKSNLEELWVEAVLGNPGATTSQICAIINKGPDDKALISARKEAERRHRVKSAPGEGRTVRWYPPEFIIPEQSRLA